MKLFISHAAVDHELAGALEDLLQLGAGLTHNDIFRSSAKGSIPNGECFVQYILKELRESQFVVAVLSRSYFRSQFCLAEVGAAQMRRVAGDIAFYSLIVPPVDFPELTGVLYGVQSGNILDARVLDELRDVVTRRNPSAPSTPRWGEKRDAFLKSAGHSAARYEATELLSQIKVDDVLVSHEPSVTYKVKLRITLRNETGINIEVRDAIWKSGTDGVRLFEPALALLSWQFLDEKGWQPVPHGIHVLHIPAGKAFRTWVGLAESVSNEEVLRRCAAQRLGTLMATFNVRGYDFAHSLNL